MARARFAAKAATSVPPDPSLGPSYDHAVNIAALRQPLVRRTAQIVVTPSQRADKAALMFPCANLARLDN